MAAMRFIGIVKMWCRVDSLLRWMAPELVWNQSNPDSPANITIVRHHQGRLDCWRVHAALRFMHQWIARLTR